MLSETEAVVREEGATGIRRPEQWAQIRSCSPTRREAGPDEGEQRSQEREDQDALVQGVVTTEKVRKRSEHDQLRRRRCAEAEAIVGQDSGRGLMLRTSRR